MFRLVDKRTKLYAAALLVFAVAIPLIARGTFHDSWTMRHHLAEIVYPVVAPALFALVLGVLAWIDPREGHGFLAPGTALWLLIASGLACIPAFAALFRDSSAMQSLAQLLMIPTACATWAIVVGALVFRA